MKDPYDNKTIDFADNARSTDPATSHAAAKQLDFAFELCSIIMICLKRRPGTFEEIASRTRLRPDQVWRRLSDLEKMGLARPTTETRKGSSGRQQRVWEAV